MSITWYGWPRHQKYFLRKGAWGIQIWPVILWFGVPDWQKRRGK